MNFSKWMFYASGLLLAAAGLSAALRQFDFPMVETFFAAESGETALTAPAAAPGADANAALKSAPQSLAETLAESFGFEDPAEVEQAQRLRVMFTTGAYARTLATIEELLAKPAISVPFRTWLQAQLPVVLASDGWASIATGNCDRAIESLRRAALLSRGGNAPMPLQGDIRRGLGYCLKQTGQLAGAEEHLIEALKANPGDTESRFLLADLYESDGRFSEAVHTLEEGAPSTELSQRLEIMRRRAGEGDLQQTQRTPHFNISYRQGEHEGLVSHVTQVLESSLDEFIERYGYREPQAPVEVVLYPTDRFSWALGGVPEWSEGIFDGRMRIPVRRVPAGPGSSRDAVVVQVLRHELIHALNANMTGGRPLPPWLEEGLAQRIGEMPTGASFPFPLKPAPFSPAADFGSSYMSFGAAAAGSIYRQSLYLVLSLEALEPDSLRRIITALSAQGGSSSDAALAPTGIDFARLYQVSSTWWKERRELAAR